MKKYDVYGIGSALMDLIIEASPALLQELNLDKGNMHLIDDLQSKLILQKIKLLDMKEIPGGSAANTIAGIRALGGSVAFCGKVGDDDAGRLYVKKMAEDGICSNIKKGSSLTGHAITFITPDSERTFATFLGAAINLDKEDINEEELKSSKILHLEGYVLEGYNKASALHAINIARENNIKISIDLADPSFVKRNLYELRNIAKGSYVLFANEQEAKEFTGKEKELALEELSKYCEYAVVKLGSEGSLIKHNDTIYRIKGVKADAVDTTGAGDMYAAAILYGLANNMPIDKAGELASFAAARVVEQLGARLTSSKSLMKKLNSLRE